MDTRKEDVERLLVNKYPGLEAQLQASGSLIIRGVICSEDIWHRLRLYLPQYPALDSFQLYVQEGVEFKIYTSDNLKLQDEWKLEDLLDNLGKILPAKKAETCSKKQWPQENIYEDILALHKSKEFQMQIDEACSRLRFSDFSDYEQHYLELEIPSLRLVDHSLPECVPFGEMLAKNAGSLEQILTLYRKLLEELRPFYDNFMDIDELCHVLQPSPITTKHNTRVFPLKDRVYLKLTIGDPFACVASMALKIIGPTDEVARLRHVLSDGLGNWDSELDIHKNLLRMFDLCYFPMPDWSDGPKPDEEDNEELRCNICFVYRLDSGDVPLVSCDNPKCVLKCHAACLEEWFQTLMDGKTFLEVSFGLCPFCKALSTSFAALLND
nr:E3 ubiquitin-protein ligase FANCL isoform X2 [Drosophila takahashii]